MNRDRDGQTVTFVAAALETDIPSAEADSQGRLPALSQYRRLFAETIEQERGELIASGADEFRAVFADGSDAVRAALKLQMTLIALARADARYKTGNGLRMALTAGAPERLNNHYQGPAIRRLRALLEAAHGSQILISTRVAELVHESLPFDSWLLDLGLHGVRDSECPVRIWQLCHAALPAEFPHLRSLNIFAHNLPQVGTTFVGRRGELARIRALLAAGRMVTLTGPGGIGKTRLALKAAFAELDAYPAGAWFIDAEALTEPKSVIWSVAEALSVRESRGIKIEHSVAQFIGEKKLLLIFDGCDEVRPAAAAAVKYLQARCPALNVLSTGTRRLGVEGEVEYAVPAFGLPPMPDAADEQQCASYSLVRYEAVRLFLERARAGRPDFRVSPENGPTLCRLCADLGGLAINLEIAAAQARNFSLEQIASSYDRHYAALGSASPLPEAQTELALLNWVYGLLDAKEKILLLRLSVFPGSFEMAEASAVCADKAEDTERSSKARIEAEEVPALTEALVQRGLVSVSAGERASRFRLSAAVRGYARDRSGRTRDDALVRLRHAAYFYRLAQTAAESIHPQKREEASARIERSYHSLYRAMAETMEQALLPAADMPDGAVERLLLFAAALEGWFVRRGRLTEGRLFAEAALAVPGAREAGIARAAALLSAGNLWCLLNEPDLAQRRGEEALQLFRARADGCGTARTLELLAEVARIRGERTRAVELHDEAAALYKEMEPDRRQAANLCSAGAAAWLAGENQSAYEYSRDAISIERELMHGVVVARALHTIGKSALDRDDLTVARNCFAESLKLWRTLGDDAATAITLDYLALLACQENKPSWAVSLYSTACTLRANSDILLFDEEEAERSETESRLRAYIGTEPIETSDLASKAVPLDVVVAQSYTPNLRIIEGGMPELSGVTSDRELLQNQ